MKVQKHRAIPLKNFVGVLDDESIGHYQIAQGFDMQEILHLQTRRCVLAQNSVGRGRGS